MTQQAGRLADRLFQPSSLDRRCEPEPESDQPGAEAAAPEDAARVERAYQLLFGREATPQELQVAREFLDSTELQPLDPQQRWQQYALALLASNELLFLD